jgi:hypothetical protein
MGTDTNSASRETSPAVSLFQKAHGRMTSLQRIDEQLTGLLEQRRKIQDELKTIQSLINEEFERVMRVAGELPNKVLSQIAEAANGNGHGSDRVPAAGSQRVEVAEVIS